MEFEGKVVLVTGAARGIGRAIAEAFAKEGAKVVINDVNEEGAKKTAEEIKSSGGEAYGIGADVTKYDDVVRMVNEIKNVYGTVDILVNNAGYWTTKLFKDTTPDDWEKDIKICFYGVLHCTHAVIKDMIEKKYGRIINIVSDAGRIGEPFLAVYSGAKGAIIAFSKALAKEVAKFNITVNCVSPGITKTPGVEEFLKSVGGEEKLVKAYPRGRLGLPEDIANAVLFFASDRSEFITGQVLSVSGGYTTVG